MEPLTPEDLLIRQKPLDDEHWLDGAAHLPPEQAPAVSLERFQTLEHVVRDSPINVDPYLELARIYLQNSRWNDAKRVLEQAVARFSESEEANYLFEEALINRSLHLLTEAKADHQAEPTRLTLETLERCHIDLNVLREKVCRARLVRHPDQIELFLPLATALDNLAKRDEAIQYLQKAVAVPELRASAALLLGQILERAKRVPEALSAYRRAAFFRVPPPEPDIRWSALSSAANLAQHCGMIDSAIRYVEMMQEMQPHNTSIQQRLDELKDMLL